MHQILKWTLLIDNILQMMDYIGLLETEKRRPPSNKLLADPHVMPIIMCSITTFAVKLAFNSFLDDCRERLSTTGQYF